MSQPNDNRRPRTTTRPRTTHHPRSSQVEFVVAQAQDGMTRRYEATENPCPDDMERECAEWVEERLTAVYNS